MESSLSLQLVDYAREIGSYLGYGRTASQWTGWDPLHPYVPQSFVLNGLTVGADDSQLGHIMACLKAGCHQFYFPRLADQGPVAHKWSFLTPQRTLVTNAGQGVYDLPDDFAGLEGEFTYQPTDSTWLTVQRRGIGEISRDLQCLFGIQDKPNRCAVYPKATDGILGQRFAVSFAPVPDSTYTLTYTSNILPMALSATNPFPLGGAAHGETILESCLAVAESRFQDEPDGTHKQAFLERLQASIAVDVRDFKAAYLGYCADRSDCREWNGGQYGPWGPWNGGTLTNGATYNGVMY